MCSLSSIERFKETVGKCFHELSKGKNIATYSLNAFAYEFAIVSGNTSLAQLLVNDKLDSEDEYIFILKNYLNLFYTEKYLKTLTVFKGKYPVNKLSECYQSPFRQKFFFDSDKFNWSISLMSKNIADDSFYSTYQSLVNLGIETDVLIESAKKKSAEFNITEAELKLRMATHRI